LADQNVLSVAALIESSVINSNELASVANRTQDLAVTWLLRVNIVPALA
jgi:hypothetical protein